MEEIDLTEIMGHFKSKIPFIILITFIVLALGTAYSLFIKKPVYTSSSTIVLASSLEGTSSSNIQADVTLNQKLVGTYREIVKSRSVLESVIDDLKLDITYEALAGMVNVSSVTDTEIIKISVTNTSPKMAKKITKKVTTSFSKQVSNIYNMKNVNVLDEASMPVEPSNMSLIKECMIYFMIGFIISCALVFIMFYFDTTIKSVEQVENKLKLPILGTIPLYSKGGN